MVGHPPATAGDVGLLRGPGRSHVPGQLSRNLEPQLPKATCPGAGALQPV